MKDVSIVMPAFNESEAIDETLSRLKEFMPSGCSYEIIVVDNGSTDSTTDIAKRHGCIVLLRPCVSVASLRNAGAAEACGAVLIFIDADISVTQTWSQSIDRYCSAAARQRQIFGSEFLPAGDEGILDKYWFRLLLRNDKKSYVGSGHLIVSKLGFHEIGGFDEALKTGEDYEFCHRAKKMGYETLLVPDLAVVHRGYPKKIREFVRREAWHGTGDLVSLHSFFSSKVALAANAFVLLSVMFIAALGAAKWEWVLCALAAIVCLLGMVSCKKFPKLSAFERLVNSLLVGVYLFGRAMSPLWSASRWR